jgi:phosphate-selective porin OprO/OprP
MTRRPRALLLASTLFAGAVPAHAQAPGDIAAELAALRAQVGALQARVAELENRQVAAIPAVPTAAPPAAAAASPAASAQAAPTGPEITFRGGPQITAPGGWSFKPRGRVQIDAAFVSSPDGVSLPGLGFSNRLRRGRLGVEGTVPGNIGYRFDVDFANSGVEIIDAFVTFRPFNSLLLTVGQQDNFQSLEHLTSDNFTSFVERASIDTAFNFERRLGVSATLTRGAVIANLGVFSDNFADLNDAPAGSGLGDENSSVSVDGRIVFAPRVGTTQLHFGASAHYRDQSGLASSGTFTRYRVRPLTRTTNVRFIGTPGLLVDNETDYGVEFAAIHGPFHAVAEGHWMEAGRINGPTPTFFGGYAELGWYITGETRGYRNGVFDRTRVLRPLSAGGPGAFQLNVRYDRLDLSDSGITGGSQNAYLASVIWIPSDYVRFLLNYGHVAYHNAIIPAALGDRDYGVDVIGGRAQFDF